MSCILCQSNCCSGMYRCLECNANYCGVDCLYGDKTHRFECKIQGPCIFCNQPLLIDNGFMQSCGHGIHNSCSIFCDLYGLNGCPTCPSKTLVLTAAREMLQEYARVCLSAIKLQYPRPELPPSFLKFIIKGGDDPELLYIQGNVYANGIGVPIDGEKACKLLTRSAVFGHATAMYTISGDNAKKLAIAAKGGSSRACFELGILLEDATWMERAIELSPFPFDTKMRYTLALSYADNAQIDDSLPLFYMLARMNHVPSILKLARIFFDMSEKNSKYLIKSMHWAMQVDSPAALKIRGSISLKLGFPEKAFEYMLMASKSSDPAGIDATYELARFYELGCGTPLNDVLAMEMLEKGAAAGHSSAQFDLAIRQFNTDRPRAFRLLREASKTHAVAMHMLARMEEPDAESLLANAGKLIPSALFDLAVRKMDDDMFYEADALLKEAIKMPEPTFNCGMLNVERAHELIAEIAHKTKSMDNIIRLVQFGNYVF